MPRFRKINEATMAFGYGEIIDYNSLRHGAGETNTGHNVWLPIMYEPDGNWYNLYNDTNVIKGKNELIIQIPNSETAFKDWKEDTLVKTPCHVIVRTKIDENIYDYDDIGEFCDILHDSQKHITIRAKINTPTTIGKELNGNRLKWVSGFAASETEAREKMDKLIGPTLRMLKGI
jgi:hypothetical protein